MSLNKKILAAAIVSGLFATSAQAVTLSFPTPTNAPVTVATEAFGTADLAGTDFVNIGTLLDIVSPLNYAFSPNEVRYARVECGTNVRFATAGVPVIAGAVAGAINGLGTNAIYFSITAGIAPPIGTITFTIDGTRNISAGAAASCTYGLYDQPSQAQAGGTTGRIATTSGAYINFASGYAFSTNSQQVLTANVEADTGAFTKFTTAGPVNATLGRLTNLRFDAATGIQIDEGGGDITLAAIFGAATSINIAGDFSYITGAANVYLGSDAICTSALASATVPPLAASFTVGGTAQASGVDRTLCVVPNTTAAIPEGSYTATLNAVVANAVEYSVSSTGPLAAGSIVRNGTQLQAPLAQVPSGWMSRIVLTNTGGTARAYAMTFTPSSAGTISEPGSTYTGALTSSGTVPANGLLVLRVGDLFPTSAFGTTPTRGMINVNIAGPNNQIQGLYQLVNAATGGISNHVMVRPGSN